MVETAATAVGCGDVPGTCAVATGDGVAEAGAFDGAAVAGDAAAVVVVTGLALAPRTAVGRTERVAAGLALTLEVTPGAAVTRPGIAMTPTTAAAAASSHLGPPSGRGSRQFEQKPETGVAT